VVECRELFREPVSTTFHGRDILAPVAAELARGMSPAAVGRRVGKKELAALPLAPAVFDRAGPTVTGEVVSLDHFGNLLTNLSRDLIREAGGPSRPRIFIRIKETLIAGVAPSYGAARPGELLALFGSRGMLEIAINQGSAGRKLAAGPGEPVLVTFS
jgi:S-adenosyl-L-methionine hydrolase (adenosine-forming)